MKNSDIETVLREAVLSVVKSMYTKKAEDDSGNIHEAAAFFADLMPGHPNAGEIAHGIIQEHFKGDFPERYDEKTEGMFNELHRKIKEHPDLQTRPKDMTMEEEHAASRGIPLDEHLANLSVSSIEDVVRKAVMDVLKDYNFESAENFPSDLVGRRRNIPDDGEEMMTAHHLDDATGRISKVSVPASTQVDTAGEGEGGHFSTYENAVRHLHMDGGLLPQGERAEDYEEIVSARQAHPLPTQGDVKTSMYQEKMASFAADYMNVRGYDETSIQKRAKIVEAAVKSLSITADEFRIYANKSVK